MLTKRNAAIEGFTTSITFMGFLNFHLCMDLLMVDKAALLTKTFVALLTLIRFFSCMYSLMLNQWCDLGEGFSTCLAVIGLLSSVDPLVFGQG